jgi:hypothetical protein
MHTIHGSGKIRYLEFLAAALGVMDETWLSEDRLKDAFQVNTVAYACIRIYTHTTRVAVVYRSHVLR